MWEIRILGCILHIANDSLFNLAKWKIEFYPAYRTIGLIWAKVKDVPLLGYRCPWDFNKVKTFSALLPLIWILASICRPESWHFFIFVAFIGAWAILVLNGTESTSKTVGNFTLCHKSNSLAIACYIFIIILCSQIPHTKCEKYIFWDRL